MTPTSSFTADPGLQSLIEKARTDLASRLDISVDEISLAEAAEVEWPDSSLGCPQSGMSYLQVITPGYIIILQTSGQSYEYHSNRDAYFVNCEKPDSPMIPKP